MIHKVKSIALFLLFSLIISYGRPGAVAEKVAEGDYVVLLHGLGRTALSMKKLERHLRSKGFDTVNLSYPSTKYSVGALADVYLKNELTWRCPDTDCKIHFVTHSLGGIILRYYLKNNHIPNLGRVVMLSPPNQGSEIADYFSRNIFFKLQMGPSGQQLGISKNGMPNSIGPADFELGIITGDKTLNPYFSKIIPGPDDGKVSVERAKLDGMSDFLVVHKDHMFIMQSKEVIEQVIFFLVNGRFWRESSMDGKK